MTPGVDREGLETVLARCLEIRARPLASDLGTLVDAALFDAYVTPERPSDALSQAIAMLPRAAPNVALFGGLAQAGWAVAHLAAGESADQVCEAIDRVLLDAFASGWRGDYDLIGGLVGIGVYALEREQAGYVVARGVLDQLEAAALWSGSRVAWLTQPESLLPEQRVHLPDGYVDLGMAHGLAGVVALLARYVRRGLETTRARRLLDASVLTLLDVPPRDGGRFHARDELGQLAFPALAWCHGDLGISVALHAAAIACDESAWQREALELARACTRRDPDLASPGLCHGIAGAAHIFTRLHQATGDRWFAEAAQRWVGRLVACAASLDDHSLLRGSVGIALAAHAWLSGEEPAWDRMLLIDP